MTDEEVALFLEQSRTWTVQAWRVPDELCRTSVSNPPQR